MKRILSIAFALALAGGLLSGCDQNNANRPAGSGGTASPSGSTSGSASGSAGSTSPDQPKKTTPAPTTPAKPGSPSGSTSGK